MPNARMHSQILAHLGGIPRILVDPVEIDEYSSAYTVLDMLDQEYNKPWVASQLLIEQLHQMPMFKFGMDTSKDVIQSRRFVMQLKRIQTEMTHVPDANADLKNLMDKIMLKLHKKLIISWEDKCEETAKAKHPGLYLGANVDFLRQNQKFQVERFDDLIRVLDSHVMKNKSIVDRYGKDGYLNPENMASSAAEALKYQEQRLQKMSGDKSNKNNQQQQSSNNQQRSNNNNQGRGLRSYATVAATGQQNQQNRQQQPQRSQGNTGQTGAAKGPAPGERQIFEKDCFVCGKKNEHWSAQCTNPNQRSPLSLLKSAIKARACYNCFRVNSGHKHTDCPHGHCKKDGCTQKHHTLLHGADWQKIRDLQIEVREESDKRAQVKAAKAEAAANAAQGDTSNSTQQNSNSGGNRKQNKRNRQQAPAAPNASRNQSRAHAVTEQVVATTGSKPAAEDSK